MTPLPPINNVVSLEYGTNKCVGISTICKPQHCAGGEGGKGLNMREMVKKVVFLLFWGVSHLLLHKVVAVLGVKEVSLGLKRKPKLSQ